MTRTTETYDAIVVGLGAIGAAALYQLARRGARVLGLDQFSPPHARGSSHGETRITRLAIGEGRHYVPLAMRSHEIWRELEVATGEDLLTVTGGLFFAGEGPSSPAHGATDFIGETVAAAEQFGIEHQVLDAAEIARRYPQFGLRGGERGYWEREAGFVRPERCIAAQLDQAEKFGAEVLRHTPVVELASTTGTTLRVATPDVEYAARQVVLCAGAWVRRFLPVKLHELFTVYRQLLFWFEVAGDPTRFESPHFPVFIRTSHTREDLVYGFPAIDGARGGIKIAYEQYPHPFDPDLPLQPPSDAERRHMHDLAARFLPIGPHCLRATACLFTVTPDGEFVIDRHPEQPGVLIASPCSGHGFKHSAALGEMLAELVLDGESRYDRSHFELGRFGVS